jgi:hypothetical protein
MFFVNVTLGEKGDTQEEAGDLNYVTGEDRQEAERKDNLLGGGGWGCGGAWKGNLSLLKQAITM